MIDPNNPPPDLGPCCVCGHRVATNITMLDRKAPVPGTGWGCVTCGAPSDGAIAVLCNKCLGFKPIWIVNGFALGKQRIAADAYPNEPFDHLLPKELH